MKGHTSTPPKDQALASLVVVLTFFVLLQVGEYTHQQVVTIEHG
jgi:hypothetical protein